MKRLYVPWSHPSLTWTLLLLLALLTVACGGGDPPTPEIVPTATATIVAIDPTATSTPLAESTPVPVATPTEAAPEEPTPVPAAENPGQETGPVRITIGVNLNFPPFAFLDESGMRTGFDIDLMDALTAAANLDVRYVGMPFTGMLEGALSTSEIDAIISAITVTEERKDFVDFTDAYFLSGQGMAVRGGDITIRSLSDLTAQTRVGVKSSTTGSRYAEGLEVEVTAYDESLLLVEALINSEVDAVVLDAGVLAYYATTGMDLALVESSLTEEFYAIAVNKNRPDLSEQLNAALAQVRADGAYTALLVKWFGEEFTQE
jgi:ABC-type amino acid transport substrate-binding protein